MTPSRLAIAVRVLCLAGLARLVWVVVGYHVLDRAERHHLETAWMIFIAVAIITAACLPTARESTRQTGDASPATIVAWIAASLLLYYPSLNVGLLSDDFVLVVRPPIGADWQFFRPLPLIVWKIIYPLIGSAGLHVLNATLHGVNAFLVYRLCTVLLPHAPRTQGVAAAAVFLTFPAAVEPVTWAAGVFDVGLVTFALLYFNALLSSASAVNPSALLALAAALLCKETAVVLPVVGWSLRLVTPAHAGTLAWSTAIVGAFAATRMLFTDAPEITAPLGYFLKEMASRPFATLGTPFTSVEVSENPIAFGVVPQLVMAVLVMTYLFDVRHGVRPLLPASWVLLGVAPLLSYFFISETLQGSRYLYLPLVGWSLLIAHLSDGGHSRALRICGTLLVGLIVLNGVAGTSRHQSDWVRGASLRDAILLEAQRVIVARGCAAAAFAGLPDSEGGAYVFRNGFAEAALLAGIRVVPSATAPTGCAFTWRGGAFVGHPEDANSPADSPRTK